MREGLVILLVIGALIIGALAGYFYEMRRATTIDVSLQASTTYQTLRDLRSGDTNAVFQALEDNLDMRVIELRAILDENPRIKRASNYTNMLRRIAQYRSAYPHHNDNRDIDEMVTAALKSVSGTGR